MKVRVEVTVDVDPEAWALNYGVEGSAAIREDVKRKVSSDAVENLALLGLLREKD